MLHTLRFSLQNAVYFTMLPFLVPVLFTFYIQGVINLNVKLRCQKVNHCPDHWDPRNVLTFYSIKKFLCYLCISHFQRNLPSSWGSASEISNITLHTSTLKMNANLSPKFWYPPVRLTRRAITQKTFTWIHRSKNSKICSFLETIASIVYNYFNTL